MFIAIRLNRDVVQGNSKRFCKNMLGIVQKWQLQHFFVASLLFPGTAMCTVFTETPAILPVVRKIPCQ
jgi:hypothetical protein